jgi:hypothetical protein
MPLSKKAPRFPLSLPSDVPHPPPLTAAIWPDGVEQAYATSLIRQCGQDSAPADLRAPIYAAMASKLPPRHIQSKSTGDKLTLQQIHLNRASQFHFRRQ